MKTFHSAELLSSPPKPISYLVEGLLPARCGGDISGMPDSGKSTIMLSMAAATRDRLSSPLANHRQPAGMVTSLVGSSKPVFAWLAQTLGEPIDCHGKQSRSIYVADRCLIPISKMTDADIEIISRSQAQVDFDSALQDLKEIIDRNDITPEELEHFVDKAGAQFFIERALEVVAVPVALREIGFYPSPESEDSLVWTGIHEGMELHFLAGEKWIANWVIVGTGNSKRQAVWDERTLPSQSPRGKIVSTVLSIWRTAFGNSVTPDYRSWHSLWRLVSRWARG